MVDVDRIRCVSETAALTRFLKAAHAVTQAFGFKVRDSAREVPTAPPSQAIAALERLLCVVEDCHDQAVKEIGKERATNGPDGCIPDVTVKALRMLITSCRGLCGNITRP